MHKFEKIFGISGGILFCLLFISLPHSLRLLNKNNTWIGPDLFYTATIKNSSFFSVIIQNSLELFGEQFTGIILPGLITLIGIILSSLAIKKYLNSIKQEFFIISMAMYPSIITFGSQLNYVSWSFFLISTALYSIAKNNILLTGIAFVLLSDFSIIHIVMLTIIAFILDAKYFKKIVSLAVIISFIRLLLPLDILPIFKTEPIYMFFSDTGGALGVSVFFIIAVCIGAVKLWKFKKKLYSLYLLSIVSIISSFHYVQLIPYTILIFSICSAFSFEYLLSLNWELKEIKRAFLSVFFLSILFSAITHAYYLSESPPNMYQKIEFSKLNEISNPNFFSSEQNSPLIAYWSEKPAVVFTAENEEDLNLLLQTYDINVAVELIKKYNITHIILTQEMWEGELWTEKDNGLSLLVNNKKNFQLIYNSSKMYVWRFIGD